MALFIATCATIARMRHGRSGGSVSAVTRKPELTRPRIRPCTLQAQQHQMSRRRKAKFLLSEGRNQCAVHWYTKAQKPRPQPAQREMHARHCIWLRATVE